jgi:hypothetical protein
MTAYGFKLFCLQVLRNININFEYTSMKELTDSCPLSNAGMKGCLKTASGHMYGFPKAAANI